MSSTATLPDLAAELADVSALTEARWRYCPLEGLRASAPINCWFVSCLDIGPEHFHAAGAVHGTPHFEMPDDGVFHAANTGVTDRFTLTTTFNLHFSKPQPGGRAVADVRKA